MKGKKCLVCGFDKRVHKHHIIKINDFGSDDENNLIYLCPNHHWIADFGDEKDKERIIKLIKEISGKEGSKLPLNKQELLDKKIRILCEEFLSTKFTEKEWREHKDSYNYEIIKKQLIGRNCPVWASVKINREAEILLLIDKLNIELKKNRENA